MAENIIFAGIAPHPPLLVPEIGGVRIERVKASAMALDEFAKRLVKSRPETVVIISPHSPGDARRFGAFSGIQLQGNFSQFGAPQVAMRFDNDQLLLDTLQVLTSEQNIPFQPIPAGYPLDHGVLVPMFYLSRAGWQGPILSLSFTSHSISEHIKFGQAIKAAAARVPRKIAFVASADLSHYLSHESPYHFEPEAHLFDEQVCDAITTNNLPALTNIDQDLRQRAGECGYRSILVAIGAIDKDKVQPTLLSYESPFGVGYLTAILKEL